MNWIPEMSLPSNEPTAALLTQKRIEEDKVEILREEWKFASQVVNKFFMWIIVTAIMSNAVYVILKAPSGNLL